jgi:hypothetical protein
MPEQIDLRYVRSALPDIGDEATSGCFGVELGR